MPIENRSSNTEQMVNAPFRREDRYIVIKRKDLANVPVAYRSHLVDPMLSLLSHLPNRECLVIESDWPEYEPAWAAIEARASGRPTSDGFSAEQMTAQGADGYRNGIKAAAELAADYPELAQAIRALPLPQ